MKTVSDSMKSVLKASTLLLPYTRTGWVLGTPAPIVRITRAASSRAAREFCSMSYRCWLPPKNRLWERNSEKPAPMTAAVITMPISNSTSVKPVRRACGTVGFGIRGSQ